MHLRGTAFFAFAFLSSCAHAPVPDSRRTIHSPRAEEDVRARLTVPPGLDPRHCATVVVQAEEIVMGFAAAHGWSKEAQVPSFDSVEIFANQQDLWRRILQINNTPLETPLTVKGLAAALEGRVLLAVSPKEYARVAPEYAALPDAWTRLLAHEIIHRLHVEVLQGNENSMGPPWFFEGFAVFGAGQNLDVGLVYASLDEALQGAHDTSPQAYRRFVAAVRYVSRLAPLPDLVRRASSEGFEGWLRDQELRASSGRSATPATDSPKGERGEAP